MSRSRNNKRRLPCRKDLKKITNKRVRHKKDIQNGSYYKKLTTGYFNDLNYW